VRKNALHKQDVHTGFEQAGCKSSAMIVRAQLCYSGGMRPPSDDASDRLGRKP